MEKSQQKAQSFSFWDHFEVKTTSQSIFQWHNQILKIYFSGAVLALSVKTSSRSAVLAYNAGTANSNDFVAVEVRTTDDYDLVTETLITTAIVILS